MCAQDNMQVCNMTTPAQLFHVLRRQMKRDIRKPLIIMSPKSLLRHPLVVSKIKDFTEGEFTEVIGDLNVKAKDVESAILCSGKVYYDLLAAKEKVAGQEKIALIRVEQLYPFSTYRFSPILKSYSKLKKLVWCQEEPKNMGAWTYMQPRLTEILADFEMSQVSVSYAGRTERASPATGSEKVHQYEQAELVQSAYDQALGIQSKTSQAGSKK